MPSSRRWEWGVLLGAAVLVALPGLFMGLHADDWFQIQRRSVGEIAATFAGDWSQGFRGEGGFYRPLIRLCFGMEAPLFGISPVGYHFTNLLLFVAATAGLLRASGTVAPNAPSRLPSAAFLAVLVFWVLNPMKVEALYWVSGRTDLLAATLCVWSLSFALESLDEWRPRRAALSLAFLALALMTKEVSLAMTLVLPLAWLLLGDQGPHRRRQAIAFVLSPLLLAVMYALWRRTILGGLGGYAAQAERTVWDMALNLAAQWSALLVPFQINAAGTFSMSALVIAGALLAAHVLWTGLNRVLLFGLGGMVLTTLPMVFLPIGPADGARVLALPMVFVVLMAASVLGRATNLGALAVLGVVSLVFAWQGARAAAEFICAKAPNRAALEQLWQQVHSLPDGSTFVAVEPDRRERRRILDPGVAPLLYLAARARATGEATTGDQHDPESGKVALYYDFGGRVVQAAGAPHFWMDEFLLFKPASEQAPDRFVPGEGAPLSGFLPLEIGLPDVQFDLLGMRARGDGIGALPLVLEGRHDAAVTFAASVPHPLFRSWRVRELIIGWDQAVAAPTLLLRQDRPRSTRQGVEVFIRTWKRAEPVGNVE